MKTMTIIFLTFISFNIFAQTNWQDIGEQARGVDDLVLEVNGSNNITIEVVPLKNNELRFNGFKSLRRPWDESKLVFVKEDKWSEFERSCKNYDLFARRGTHRKFKAYLVLNKKPILDEKFTFQYNGEIYGNDKFQNPIHFGDFKLEGVSENDSPYYVKRGKESLEEYQALLQNAFKNATSDEVIVDLTEFNGVACDIGKGYISPRFYREFSYERGRPPLSYWIKIYDLRAIHESFEEGQLKLPRGLNNQDKTLLTGVNLGRALEKVHRDNKEQVLDIVLEDKERRDRLLNVLQISSTKDEILKRLAMIADFKTPVEPIETSGFTIFSGKIPVEEITE